MLSHIKPNQIPIDISRSNQFTHTAVVFNLIFGCLFLLVRSVSPSTDDIDSPSVVVSLEVELVNWLPIWDVLQIGAAPFERGHGALALDLPLLPPGGAGHRLKDQGGEGPQGSHLGVQGSIPGLIRYHENIIM